MSQVNPYLRFNGNCREAMTFYKDCIGGELKLQTVGDAPAANQMAGDPKNRIMHAVLTRGDFVIMGSDHMGPGAFQNGDAVSLAIDCDSEIEAKTLFDRLSSGGKIAYPLHTEYWGGIYGSFTDQYGVEWMVNYEHPDFKAPPGKPELVITRFYDAPRARVYKAYTDPKLIPQWWGPKIFTTTVDIMNVRPGGEWRFVQRDAAGAQHAFRGIYHDVKTNERLVQTFEYENIRGHVLLSITTFEDKDGGTRVIEKSIFESVEDRDAMVNMGMEAGEVESTSRFNEVMQRMRQTERA